jgi:hypothetical protein
MDVKCNVDRKDSDITMHKQWKEGTLLVAQLVEALRYKSEGRGFDSRWCH